MLCMDYSKLWMSKSYFHCFEFTKLFSFSGFLQNAWTWIATLRVCSFFFSCEFHDFLIWSDASWTHSPLDCRILGTTSATIWKSDMLENQSANLQAHFFFQVQTALSLFTINTPHQLPSCYQFWHLTSPNHHAHVTIGPIIRCVRNPPIRKRSHISLQFCWISGQAFDALIPRRSRQMV